MYNNKDGMPFGQEYLEKENYHNYFKESESALNFLALCHITPTIHDWRFLLRTGRNVWYRVATASFPYPLYFTVQYSYEEAAFMWKKSSQNAPFLSASPRPACVPNDAYKSIRPHWHKPTDGRNSCREKRVTSSHPNTCDRHHWSMEAKKNWWLQRPWGAPNHRCSWTATCTIIFTMLTAIALVGWKWQLWYAIPRIRHLHTSSAYHWQLEAALNLFK